MTSQDTIAQKSTLSPVTIQTTPQKSEVTEMVKSVNDQPSKQNENIENTEPNNSDKLLKDVTVDLLKYGLSCFGNTAEGNRMAFLRLSLPVLLLTQRI